MRTVCGVGRSGETRSKLKKIEAVNDRQESARKEQGAQRQQGLAEFFGSGFFRDSGAYSPWSADNLGLFSQLHRVSVCAYQPGIRAAAGSCVCACPRCLSVA